SSSKTLVATTSCWLCGLPVTNKQVFFSQWTIPGKSSLKLLSRPTLIDGATKFYWNGSKATSIAAPHNTEGKHESGRSCTSVFGPGGLVEGPSSRGNHLVRRPNSVPHSGGFLHWDLESSPRGVSILIVGDDRANHVDGT